MEESKDRQIVQQVFESSLSGIQDDPWMAQRVLNKAHEAQRTGGFVVKKKIPFAVIIIICLFLVSSVALAAVLMNLHIEKAMDIAKDKGAFENWTLEDKIALIETMKNEGIPLPQEKLHILQDDTSPNEVKEQAATDLLVEIYGSAEHISHFTIASHDWGDPFQWTLEQQVWFWETLREKGLYTGKIKYLLPGENDLTRDQVVLIAKQAIQDAYDLPEEIMQGFDADVTFFTIEGTDTAPRWRVYLGYATEEAADYTVLLTRDGQVTEDASLYIFKPEALAAQERQNSQTQSTVLTPYEKRMMAADVLYISWGNRQYHFLEHCPSVSNEPLAPSTNIDGCQPCPYCVQHSELWSAEDKIIYGVMIGDLPSSQALPASKIEDIARDHLRAAGFTDVDALVPYLRYIKTEGRYCYQVFFGKLEHEQINDLYTVIVDAQTGEILRTITEWKGLG